MMTTLSRILQMTRHAVAVFRAPGTPLPVKLLLASGLVYVLSPWDLIPEWVPVLGMLDDLALVALLITWASNFRIDSE
ncbi:YkvA family protein [Desulfolithobacter sp.]